MDKIFSAEIVCVGTELLMGQTVNTNAAYLARELAGAGIPSYRQTVIGDNPERLIGALEDAVSRSDLVVVTGGLGPTEDDITAACTARFLGRELVFDERSAESIRSYFSKTGREMPDSNLKQAMIPFGAAVMPNSKGTAPGVIVEFGKDKQQGDEKIIVLLPGPPYEMKNMFADHVLPYITKKAPIKMRSEYIRLFGIGESAAEDRIRDIIDSTINPTIAPYCSEGECMFRITVTQNGSDDARDARLLEQTVERIRERLGDHIYEIGHRNLPEVVFDRLTGMSSSISFAESCTGGMLGAALTDIPGASAVFKGAVTAYSNDAKVKILGVDPDIIRKYGAVSRETAEAMALSCRKLFDSDLALSVTGVAGPGESGTKPAGLVHLCLVSEKGTVFREIRIHRDRNGVRKLAVLNAFDLIRREL